MSSIDYEGDHQPRHLNRRNPRHQILVKGSRKAFGGEWNLGTCSIVLVGHYLDLLFIMQTSISLSRELIIDVIRSQSNTKKNTCIEMIPPLIKKSKGRTHGMLRALPLLPDAWVGCA